MQSGNVALQRTVGFYRDKSALRTQTLSLSADYLNVLGIYFGNYHWNVWCASVRRVVGNNRTFSLCVTLLKSLYLVLFHIHCAENKICH